MTLLMSTKSHDVKNRYKRGFKIEAYLKQKQKKTKKPNWIFFPKHQKSTTVMKFVNEGKRYTERGTQNEK